MRKIEKLKAQFCISETTTILMEVGKNKAPLPSLRFPEEQDLTFLETFFRQAHHRGRRLERSRGT